MIFCGWKWSAISFAKLRIWRIVYMSHIILSAEAPKKTGEGVGSAAALSAKPLHDRDSVNLCWYAFNSVSLPLTGRFVLGNWSYIWYGDSNKRDTSKVADR